MVKSLSIVTIAVHAAKYPNVISISNTNRQVEGKGSTTIPHEGFGNTALSLL